MPVGNTRIEDAALCFKCKQVGILTKSYGSVDAKGHPCDVAVYHCDNEKCRNYQQGWIVQSTPDGRVYDRERRRDGKIQKTYPDLSSDQLEYGRRVVERVKRAAESENQEIKPE